MANFLGGSAGLKSFSNDNRSEGRHFKGGSSEAVKNILSAVPLPKAAPPAPQPTAAADHLVAGTTTSDAPTVCATQKRTFFPEHEAASDTMGLSLMGPTQVSAPHGEGIRTFHDQGRTEGDTTARLLGGDDAVFSKSTFVPTLDVDIAQLKSSSAVGGVLTAPEGGDDRAKKSKVSSIKIFSEEDQMGNVLSQVAPKDAPAATPPVVENKENSNAMASLLAVDEALENSTSTQEPPRKQARKAVPDRRSSQMGFCLGKVDPAEPKRKLVNRNPNTETTLVLS